MGTRAVIGRAKGDAWEGRYHHWDGYPTGLGKRLFEVVQQLGITRAKKLLIDEHPAGWSTILGCNIRETPGFIERGQPEDQAKKGPQCYCHGDRHEEQDDLITSTGDSYGTEWAYIFGGHNNATMTVFVRLWESGRWVPVESVTLNGPEPDWAEIEGRGSFLREEDYRQHES